MSKPGVYTSQSIQTKGPSDADCNFGAGALGLRELSRSMVQVRMMLISI